MRDRRREVGRHRGRRRLMLLLAAVTLAAAALGFLWLRSSDVFTLRYVSFPVLDHVSESSIRAAVAPATGENLLRVSTEEVERRLAALPYVREARAYRQFPDSLEIQIDEYEPVARLRSADEVVWLVADDGTVLEEAGEAGSGLPLIVPEAEVWPSSGHATGPQVLAAVILAVTLVGPEGEWPLDRYPVDHLGLALSSDLAMVLATGTEVRLGDASELKEKLMVALEVIDRYSREGKELEYVDVHVPSRVVAKAR